MTDEAMRMIPLLVNPPFPDDKPNERINELAWVDKGSIKANNYVHPVSSIVHYGQIVLNIIG